MKRRHLVILSLVLSAAGCKGAATNTLEQPEKITDEMVTTFREPVLFVRHTPGLSLAARDYLYIAPMAADREEDDQIYLWVGLASTVDRRVTSRSDGGVAGLSFRIEEGDITLRVDEWQDHLDRNDENESHPYPTDLPLERSSRAILTREELDLLAAKQPKHIALTLPNGDVQQFKHWRGEWLAWSSAHGTRVSAWARARTRLRV